MFSDNILLVFKDRKSVTKNNDYWTDKFQTGYNTFQFFLNDHLSLTNEEIIKSINHFIEQNSVSIVLFEGDHTHIIDYDFVSKINKKTKKGLFLGDDMVWHYLNAITAQSCNFVLSSCPISALKFEEIGVDGLFVPIECNGQLLKDYKQKKIFDVLHFGREKTIRSEYISFLKDNGINIKSVSPYDVEADSMEKLAKLINQAKIVLNFTESSNGDRKFNNLRIFKSFYQLKGRIQMAGLSNALCITQYSPAINLMYEKGELPFFRTKKECLKLVKYYLDNEDELKKQTEIFRKKSLIYEDSNYIKTINSFFKNIKTHENKNFLTPFWYNIAFLNQAFRLRFKRKLGITFFKEFFSQLKNCNKSGFIKNTLKIIFCCFFFIRYLPFLFLKITFQFNKKFRNPQEYIK